MKTHDGWKHSFIPTDNDRVVIHPGFESDLTESFARSFERCVICGEPREEHQKLVMRTPDTKRLVKESFSTLGELYDNELEEDKYSSEMLSSPKKGTYICLQFIFLILIYELRI